MGGPVADFYRVIIVAGLVSQGAASRGIRFAGSWGVVSLFQTTLGFLSDAWPGRT